MISNRAQESGNTAVSLRASPFKKLLPKLAKGTMNCLNICMEKIIRCQSEIFGTIINRKDRRIEGLEQSSTNCKIMCDCPKSSEDSTHHRKRAMGADFLAPLAHNDRVPNDRRQLRKHREDVQRSRTTNCDESHPSSICRNSRSNTKDVYCFTYSLYLLSTIGLYLVTRFYFKLRSY